MFTRSKRFNDEMVLTEVDPRGAGWTAVTSRRAGIGW
jgi:hypothetical protein